MKLNKLICLAFVSILVASVLAVTQDKYSLTSPSGLRSPTSGVTRTGRWFHRPGPTNCSR